jgi:alkylation response protein AidB-like acyl-CoA dehydrogenase
VNFYPPSGTFSARIAALCPSIAAHAEKLDELAAFPDQDIRALHEAGALRAPFPEKFGGLGLCSEPGEAELLASTLIRIGGANLAVARLYEAHLNAVKLLVSYGTDAQIGRAASDAAEGILFGLWVTDGAKDALRAGADGSLHGGKAFCSGAGHAGRAIVTCFCDDGFTRLAYVSTQRAVASPLSAAPQGLRAACTGKMSFDGVAIAPENWIGTPGDYLAEPVFSAGAWRTSAATTGCLIRLVDVAVKTLVSRGRAENLHQLARMGRAFIACETARLWTNKAARAAEGADAMPAAEIVATVNLARVAIEAASMEALALVERSLGLQAFLAGTEIERLRRDLATYLRQPAPDECLAEGAAFFVRERKKDLLF